MSNNNTRCGFVTVVGLPNAGKSTFVNAAVGSKVSIVSRKPQTTRGPLRGIALCGDTQLIFVDTPGVFQGKRKFDKAMSSSALKATKDTDFVVIMIDAGHYKRDPKAHEDFFENLMGKKLSFALVINKIDKINDKGDLLPLVAHLEKQLQPKAIFMISALKKKYVDEVLAYLIDQMPEGPWLYPEDQLSDQNDRFLTSEITRQHLIDRLGDELPFHLTVSTVKWEEGAKGITIHQLIVVARESHKRMIIGAKGQKVKEVGIFARKEMSHLLGCPIHLFLDVKVDPKWAENPEHFAAFGLDY